MAFRFALAPLLRLRQSVEHQRALTLQRAAFEVARAQERLADLDRFLAESAQVDTASLVAGRTAAELQFADRFREQLEILRRQMLEEIQILETERSKAAGAFQQAMREREALESLRERQRRSYDAERLQRQQQTLDAAFLMRHWPKQDG